jgi:membrane-associated phospholipid phosphatase
MKKMVWTAAAIVLAGCSRAPADDPAVVSVWMRTLYGVMRVERLSPPVASRMLTYATSAMYSGLASADPRMPQLNGVLNDFPVVPAAQHGLFDGTITAVTAVRVVLDTLLREGLPTTRASLARLADSLGAARASLGIDEAKRALSEQRGRQIGLAIVAWSRSDGFDATRGRKYVAPTGPGLWVNDAPASIYASQNLSGASEFVALDNPANMLQAGKASDRGLILNRPKRAGLTTIPPVNMTGMSEPHWGEVRPFALTKWDECVIPAPPSYSVDTSSELYRNATAVWEAQRGLTPDQRTVALYWADNAGESGTPVGHWISIASQMVSQRSLTAREAAKVMVLTAAAQADAFIASWGYKYKYNLIRPRTYIRRVIDPAWEPLIPTPPFPEYPSGHSTQSAAAASVISELLGSTAFDDSTSVTIGHTVRRFDSFGAAAAEAGLSRIYGGIHFPIGNVSGRELGECIGATIVKRWRQADTH